MGRKSLVDEIGEKRMKMKNMFGEAEVISVPLKFAHQFVLPKCFRGNEVQYNIYHEIVAELFHNDNNN